MDQAKIDELKRLPFFQMLNDQEIAEFAGRFAERTYQANDKIVSEKEPGDMLYVIKSGSVKISLRNEGQEDEIIEFSNNEFFGEISFFIDTLRTANVTAVKSTSLLEISRAEFNAAIFANPQIGVKILYHMLGETAKRLRQKTKERKK